MNDIREMARQILNDKERDEEVDLRIELEAINFLKNDSSLKKLFISTGTDEIRRLEKQFKKHKNK